MLKRSLLSLAVAASLVGVSGCNISSTSGNDDVSDVQPTNDATEGKVYPLFDPAAGVLPLWNDLLFAKAESTDGTADTGTDDSDANAITKAYDDLDGVSTVAPIDIKLSGSVDAATVTAGSTVYLVRLPNAVDAKTMSLPEGVSATSVEALSIATLAPFYDPSVATTNATAIGAAQPVAGQDYEATVLDIDGGTDNVIRIRPMTPLDSATKYIAVVTTGVKDTAGNAIVQSGAYSHITGTGVTYSTTIDSVRLAVNAWEDLANGTLQMIGANVPASSMAMTIAFTTTSPDTVLKSMAYPGYWLQNVITDTTIASAVLLAGGQSQATIDAILAMDNGAQTLINTAIAGGSGVLTSANTELGGITPYEHPRARSYELITNAGGVGVNQIPLASLNSALSTKMLVSQGGIELPQYTKALSADASGQWEANAVVGGVLDAALGRTAGTTPPKDVNGETNVTYRYPFATEQRKTVAPILMMEPTTTAKATAIAASDGNDATSAATYDSGCTKPANGWPVIIAQHGITVDRATTLLFGSTIAQNTCSAVVAIDLPHHGIAPIASDRNGNAVANSRLGLGVDYTDSTTPANTPFAAAVDAIVAANSESLLANLAERHEGLETDSANNVIPMTYGETANGNSGDLFIRLDVFQRTRDNLRQAVMDLLNLNATLGSIDVDGDSAADLDTSKVYFIGHSLGGIVGTTFLSVNNDSTVQAGNTALNKVQAALLAAPGGGLPKLLESSVSFSGSLLPALAAQGLTQGSADLESYLSVFQATIDSGDPMNFASDVASGSTSATPTLVFEMVGGSAIPDADKGDDTSLPDALIAIGAYPSDLVVPNNAEGSFMADGSARPETAESKLAGTDSLLKEFGLNPDSPNNSDVAPTVGTHFVTQFKEGTHSTVANADSIASFTEMMGQAATFFGTHIQAGAVQLDVTNTDVLAAPAAE